MAYTIKDNAVEMEVAAAKKENYNLDQINQMIAALAKRQVSLDAEKQKWNDALAAAKAAGLKTKAQVVAEQKAAKEAAANEPK